ncbi:MAG TPA: DinB family protein [Acidimicrobiales bacterium]|nr:DinB family protein [Acidimicrobiales bacterium]
MAACAVCGFDDESTTEDRARRELLDGVAEIALSVATAPSDAVGRRPAPEVWSPLQYACHVRDVLLAQRERAVQALVEDDPSFTPMYRDRRAELARYGDERPEVVAAHVRVAAHLFVWLFDGLDETARARPCVYNYPERKGRTVGWLLVHSAHEVVHHAGDVRRALGATGAA